MRWPGRTLPLWRTLPPLRTLLLLALACDDAAGHWHEEWDEGITFGYRWFDQNWVRTVREFYCDQTCEARLLSASTIDREFKALVDLFNQTTGGARDVYRGAFEGLDDFKAGDGATTRREASQNQWKHMRGWESILTAHTSTLALCTELKLDANGDTNVNFTRSFCYDNINASAAGPRFPDPRWSIIEDCCLKYNRTVGHGNDAFFWTDRYASPPICDVDAVDVVGYPLEKCKMVTGMGLVVGRYGRILRTSDGGATWQNIPSPTSAHLNGLSMNEENTHSGLGYEPQVRFASLSAYTPAASRARRACRRDAMPPCRHAAVSPRHRAGSTSR